jgi:hypothetical protein
MKRALILLSLSLLPLTAHARYIGPVLVKQTVPGHVMPWARLFTLCQVYPDRVVKTTTLGSLKQVSQHSAALTGPVWELSGQAYEAQQKGQLEKGSSVADIGQTSYRAVHIEKDDGVTPVLLLEKGERDVTNTSAAARSLVLLIDQACR